MRRRWAEIEKENAWLQTEYFDFDQNKEVVNQYKIESGKLPVFIFLDKVGKEFLRLSGEIKKASLLKVINENKDK
jgi:thioredoxin-related protein